MIQFYNNSINIILGGIRMLPVALFVLFTFFSAQELSANENDEPRKAIGLTGGVYSPSFSFFDQSLWNFSHSSTYGAEFDYHFNRFVFLKTGVDFHTSEASVFRPDLEWQENITFEFIPVHLSILGKYNLDHFSVFAGPGFEFVSISTTYTSPDESQFKSGYTSLLSLNIGAQRNIGSFAVSLHSKYLMGEFRQRMDVGTNLSRNDEVSLSGLKISATVKYLF